VWLKLYGKGFLAAAKIAFTFLPLWGLECLRRHHPRVRAVLRWGIVHYVVVYVLLGLLVNR
jgi:hypothetical protein